MPYNLLGKNVLQIISGGRVGLIQAPHSQPLFSWLRRRIGSGSSLALDKWTNVPNPRGCLWTAPGRVTPARHVRLKGAAVQRGPMRMFVSEAKDEKI